MSETFDVVVARVFEVPPEEAWRAWSESDLVKQWWGPTGFSCPVADVDLREGGRTLVAMRAQRNSVAETCTAHGLTEVRPHSRIAYVFNFADPEGNRLLPLILECRPAPLMTVSTWSPLMILATDGPR